MAEPVHLVIWRLDQLRCALAIEQVLRVIPAQALTPLPGTTPGVAGVINVGGQVLPVFDVRGRLGLPDRRLRASDHLLLAQAGARQVAVVVDSVEDTASYDPQDIVDPQSLLAASPTISGVLKLADGLLLIHDLSAFLSPQDEQTLATALIAALATDAGAV